MTSAARPVQGTWPTSLAAGVTLGWFAILALAMWIGLNDPTILPAWFVAYPMFALYPGVAAFAVSRAGSGVVTALATLVPLAALWLALQTAAVQETPFGIRDDRLEYGLYTLVNGLGLLVGIRSGARLMRARHTILGFIAAGVVFVVVAAFAFSALLSVTVY